MAARKAPKGDQLYTLVVDVRHGGGLYPAGLQLLGDDDLVRARPELFARFDLGYREVVAVRALSWRSPPRGTPATVGKVISLARLVGPAQPGAVEAQ
jgi:hypothetical protein